MHKLFCLLSACVAIAGCTVPADPLPRSAPFAIPLSIAPRDADLIAVSYAVGDRLAVALGPAVAPGETILFTSFAPVDGLATPAVRGRSSQLGQILAEHIASRLTQRGFTVIEARLGNELQVTPAGEFVLSRDALTLTQQYDTRAIMVGTYAGGPTIVTFNVRIVAPASNTIMAAADFYLPVGDNTRNLLQR